MSEACIFYDKFRSRIADCKKHQEQELKQEIEEYYRKVSAVADEAEQSEIDSAYLYLMRAFERN